MDGSGGFVLSLLTESFAVRAFVGTLAALGLSLLVVRLAGVRSAPARRVLVLAPIVAAIAAALASTGGQYLPTVGVVSLDPSGVPEGRSVQVLADATAAAPISQTGWLLLAYAAVATALLCRRLTGALALRRVLATTRAPAGYELPVRTVQRLAAELRMRTPEVRFADACPGGAFAAGRRRPVLVLDPSLVARLDRHELEGLCAHELAHLRRGDPLTALVVGVVRDLAFFLPALHVAARWIRHEQEEGADALAARMTGRPGALASGILKVWRGAPAGAPVAACAVLGAPTGRRWLRPVLAGAGSGGRARIAEVVGALTPSNLTPWPGSDAAAVVRHRVERLVAGTGSVTGRRRRAETTVGIAVTVVAVVAGLVAPSLLSRWHTDLLGVFYLSTDTPATSDSPAFATFRELAGEDAEVGFGVASSLGRTSPEAGDVDGGAAGACPCVASPSQLAARASAAPRPVPGMAWGSDPWRLQHLRNRPDLEATRRLLLLDSTSQQLGLLTAGRTPRAVSHVPQPGAGDAVAPTTGLSPAAAPGGSRGALER